MKRLACLFLLCWMSCLWAEGADLFAAYCGACHTKTPIEKNASAWSGHPPPDLTLVVKYRGKAWVRAYLLGFYPDKTRPYGTNNRVLPNTAMPNILASLQNNPTALNQVVTELVDYLEERGDPSLRLRTHLGFGVVLFFFILSCLAYTLLDTKNSPKP